MLKWYWLRMARYGVPSVNGLREEWGEMRDERVFTYAWLMEVCDVLHTCLRMVHPRLGVVVWPVVRKHALREMGKLEHRR